jgi:uncharacterized protein (TIGR02598 family)
MIVSSFSYAKESASSLGRESVSCRAFSLIEVVFALAVFFFSMVTIVGLMATGLHSASDSSHTEALANIQRLTRANIAATTYSNVTNATSYFTAAGYPTVQSPSNPVDSPFYTLSYVTNLPTGLVSNVKATSTIVAATVTYPYGVNASTNSFSLFIAQ